MARTDRAPKRPLNQEPDAVAWARQTVGATQKWLAEAVGISPALMCEIEAGTRNATAEVLNRIATVLNCPRSVLERKREDVQDEVA